MLPSSWPAWPALKREGEGGIWARERACGAGEEERKGTPARTLSFPPRARPNSPLPLPVSTPARQATLFSLIFAGS